MDLTRKHSGMMSQNADHPEFHPHNAKPSSAETSESATLVFDSDNHRPATGLRSAGISGRQLLYKAGSYCIDIRMQATPGSSQTVLVGQLLDSARPRHNMCRIPVALLSDGSVISHTRTNGIGEFDFGFEHLRHGRLKFDLDKPGDVVVPVPDISQPE